jgi:hypothetical protein
VTTPEPEPQLGDNLPDLRAVGLTYDVTNDVLNIDVGEYVGDFEALGMLFSALVRQLAVCTGSTLEHDDDDYDDA